MDAALNFELFHFFFVKSIIFVINMNFNNYLSISCLFFIDAILFFNIKFENYYRKEKAGKEEPIEIIEFNF